MLKTLTELVNFLLFGLSFLFPKKRALVVISEWKGLRFSDNSAAVFIASKNVPNLNFIWIAANQDSLLKASKHGSAKLKNSLGGILTQLQASTFIYSNGKDDFIRGCVTPRSRTINLWHGPPIKKIHFDNLEHLENPIRTNLRKLRDTILPYKSESPDYIMANNLFYAPIMNKSFRPKKGILVANLPRWSLPKKSFERNKPYILYAPTFRDSDPSSIPLSPETLETISREVSKHNWEFIIKTHPACTFKRAKDYQGITFIDDPTISLYESIAPFAGLIVTDISSLIFDAKYYNIPILLHFPDKAVYLQKSRNLAFPFLEISKPFEVDDLPLAIGNFLGGNPQPQINHPFLEPPPDNRAGTLNILESIKSITRIC